ncbi:sialidase family protein [Paenibacillus sp. GYB003]|uniref:sialidase family protein n=1 Tax=Paenibacillus sp. GYB003 TaxID=2994392 RepID=UPI002F967C10
MPTIRVLKHDVLYKDGRYNSFPSIVRLADGSFLLGFRQAPDRSALGSVTHVDPSSKAVTIRSADGDRWSGEASVLYDDFFYGVQDPCLNVLNDGSLLATCFMWKVYDKEDAPARDTGIWHNVYDRWAARNVGCFSLRSTDNGRSWDRPIPFPIADMAIRGNCVQLPDGSVLAPLYGKRGDTFDVVVARTTDRGATWSELATIPAADGYHFHEPNLYRTPSGKLVLFTRSLKKLREPGEKASPLFTAESADGGLTWSEPAKHDIFSPSPFHLLRLKDDRVLLSYGYRHQPFGVRAIALDPECANIDAAEETVVRDDGLGGDIGYTSAAQLEDGRVLITYYYYGDDSLRYIAGSYVSVDS